MNFCDKISRMLTTTSLSLAMILLAIVRVDMRTTVERTMRLVTLRGMRMIM